MSIFNISNNQDESISPVLRKFNIPYEYKKQLSDTQSTYITTKREIMRLPEIVSLDKERILYACSGNWEQRLCLLVCTNQHVIIIFQNTFVGGGQNIIPLNVINSVVLNKGMLLGGIIITDNANTYLIKNMNKNAASIMLKTIQNAMNIKPSNKPQNSNLDEIKKLKELLDMNAITQEEFDAKKKELLDL